MSTQREQLDYMERHLVYDVFKYFGSDAELVSHRIECSNGLDGFMSALYTIHLELKLAGGGARQEVLLAKFMKGSSEFRESSKSYTQFANEVFLYDKLLPVYVHLLRTSDLSTNIVEEFVPRAYVAQFGKITGLSISSDKRDERESVLVLQHLKPAGYELGPRLILRLDQLEAMCAVLGPYHALGYVTRILQPWVHERLRAALVDLPFVCAPNTPNVFAVLYRVAFDRFYEFYNRCRAQLLQPQDAPFEVALQRLHDRFFGQPEQLLEHIRTTACDKALPDNQFSTFLHGDFNRNNVLFHEDADGKVDNIKMFDFQELRYSTTAIDISFFLYMNTPPAERATLFPQLLRRYHKHMYEMFELLLQRNWETFAEGRLQQLLSDFSFERFEAHFKRYAFYGVMICMHFMPWLLGSEPDCERLSKLFETDMHGVEFHQLSLEIAGDEANRQIFDVMRHAFEQGYMDWI